MDDKEREKIQRLEKQIEETRKSLQQQEQAHWPWVVGFGGLMLGGPVVWMTLADGVSVAKGLVMAVGGVGVWMAYEHGRKCSSFRSFIAEDQKELEEKIRRSEAARLGGRRADD